MVERWTDDRLEAALVALADTLDVPAAESVDPPAAVRHRAQRRRRWLVAATVLVLLLAAVLAIAPSRDTVARWFGLQVERDDGAGASGD